MWVFSSYFDQRWLAKDFMHAFGRCTQKFCGGTAGGRSIDSFVVFENGLLLRMTGMIDFCRPGCVLSKAESSGLIAFDCALELGVTGAYCSGIIAAYGKAVC